MGGLDFCEKLVVKNPKNPFFLLNSKEIKLYKGLTYVPMARGPLPMGAPLKGEFPYKAGYATALNFWFNRWDALGPTNLLL